MCSNRGVLAVVIVTFSTPVEVVRRCVDSIIEAGGADHVLVVDDGGRRDLQLDRPGVELLHTQRNVGFGGAANLGFRRCIELGAAQIALLNDDVYVDPGWLAPLVARLDNDPQCAAVQPKLLLVGTDPVRVNSVGVVIGPDGAGRDVGFEELDGPQFAAPRRIDLFTGGAVLFRQSFLARLGGFDERFFLYYEDVDLGRRGVAAGWTYWCEPSSVVWHSPSTTTSQLGTKTVYWRERNRLWAAASHTDGPTFRRAVWLSVRRLRWAPRLTHARALAAGLWGSVRRLRR